MGYAAAMTVVLLLIMLILTYVQIRVMSRRRRIPGRTWITT
jgi:ABC-type sugar transport system permease subunit